MEITKDIMEAYEKVRKSGKFNMVMEASEVIKLIKVDMDTYFDILDNYPELIAKFNIKRG